MLFGKRHVITVVTNVKAHLVAGVVKNIKKRTRELTFLDGKLVKFGDETGWVLGEE